MSMLHVLHQVLTTEEQFMAEWTSHCILVAGQKRGMACSRVVVSVAQLRHFLEAKFGLSDFWTRPWQDSF